jgi:ASC-1-like (ASCH) protein
MPEEMTPENTDVNTENTDVDTDKIDRVVKVFQALSPEEQQRTYEVIGGMMEPVEEVPE